VGNHSNRLHSLDTKDKDVYVWVTFFFRFFRSKGLVLAVICSFNFFLEILLGGRASYFFFVCVNIGIGCILL